MDAKSVADAVGVSVGTLNTWASRGLIPDLENPGGGRRRHYSLDNAVHIAVMAEIIRLVRISAPAASGIAVQRGAHKRVVLLSSPPQIEGGSVDPVVYRQLREDLLRAPASLWCQSEAQIPEVLAQVPFSPAGYSVINIEQIAERMGRVQEDWDREGPPLAAQNFAKRTIEKHYDRLDKLGFPPRTG